MSERSAAIRLASQEEARTAQKRRLIDSLEDLRAAGRSAAGRAEPQQDPADLDKLREELRLSQASNRLLEHEIMRLEQKALEAIAETGRLRKQVYELEARACRCGADPVIERRKADLATLECSLLREALWTSESEIARLTKALELAMRRLAS